MKGGIASQETIARHQLYGDRSGTVVNVHGRRRFTLVVQDDGWQLHDTLARRVVGHYADRDDAVRALRAIEAVA